MMFWTLVIGLLLLASFLLIVPVLFTRPVADSNERQQQNIGIARDKKAELETQLAEGELTQQEYDGRFLDLQTALALDLERSESGQQNQRGKWVAWMMAALLPVVSIGLYFQFGTYQVITDPSLTQVAVAPAARTLPPNLSVDEMLDIIRQRLIEKPDDARGWFVLGKTLMTQQQFDEAAQAYRRALEIVGEEPGILFSLADALAMQNQGLMQGEPQQLVVRGLELEPQNPTGLWLAGLAAEQGQDNQAAYDYWNRLLPLIADDPESVQEVQRLIAILEKRDTSIVIAQVSGKQLSLTVQLGQALQGMASPTDSVFVYAKALNGPPMPLAVKRLTVAELPAQIVLSDSDAMLASMKLSGFDQVIVGARISKSGNPVAQEGDFYIELEAIDSNNPPAEISLIIDQVK